MPVDLSGVRYLELTPLRGASGPEPAAREEASFREILTQKLEEVDRLQKEADTLVQRFAAGQVEDVHQVLLAAEKANLALQLTVQVRNKVVEAYQEIARMQI